MKEREPIEAKGTHCPMCERPLDGVYDYPKIKIRMLTDVAIPKVVLDVPKKDNIAAKIKRFKEIPEVDNFLNELSLKETGIISFRILGPTFLNINPRTPTLKTTTNWRGNIIYTFSIQKLQMSQTYPL